MTQTLANENKDFWDKMANHYDEKQWTKDLAVAVTKELRNKLDFIGVRWTDEQDKSRQVRLLDYACGPGMVTRALGPYVTQTRGIDVSGGMANQYNERAKAAGLPNDTAHAQVGNLFVTTPDDSLNTVDLHDFDIAAVGFGFHHFEDYPLSIRRLAERLKPGGVVLIIDLVEDDQKMAHSASHTMRKHGFTQAEMKSIFEGEGLTEVGYSVMQEPVKMEMDGRSFFKTIFLGRATKPAS